MKRLDEILKGIKDAAALSQGDTGISSAAEAAGPVDEGVCPLCRGAGFVRHDVALDHPDFGRAFPCRCVLDEREDQRLTRLQRYSNLGPLTRLTFDSLMTRGRSTDPQNQERFAQAAAAAREFARQPSGWLVFCGPSGCGKTHLAAAIAGGAIEMGEPTLFVVVPDLLDHLRAAYSPGSEFPYDELFEQVRNAPLVVLDDLGAHSATPWAQEKLFQLVNHRYNHRLPTVFTTSRPVEELDERLRTRLTDPGLSRVFQLECGPDARTAAFGGLALPIIREMTFDSFDLGGGIGVSPEAAQSLRNAFRSARNFAEHPEGWLVLLGRTGCGKTHLAASIGHHLEGKGMAVEFCVVPDLLEMLRSAFREDAGAGPFRSRVRDRTYGCLPCPG
jgi:DNA replication protein DnaC